MTVMKYDLDALVRQDHVNADMGSGLIQKAAVTTANIPVIFPLLTIEF